MMEGMTKEKFRKEFADIIQLLSSDSVAIWWEDIDGNTVIYSHQEYWRACKHGFKAQHDADIAWIILHHKYIIVINDDKDDDESYIIGLCNARIRGFQLDADERKKVHDWRSNNPMVTDDDIRIRWRDIYSYMERSA